MTSPVQKHPRLVFLPDMITSFNLFTGFLSILMVTRGKVREAAWLTLLSMIWDSLDGNIARMFKNPTQFGRELDSLADIVSFVTAPALLAATFLVRKVSPWSLLLLYIYLAAGAFRLARFNIRPPVKGYFEGLPTPAAALTLSATILAYIKNDWEDHWLLIPLVILLAAAMTSEIRYPKLSAMPFSKWQSFLYMTVALLFAVLFFFNLETAMSAVLLLFLFVAPLYCLSSYRSHPREDPLPLHTKDI